LSVLARPARELLCLARKHTRLATRSETSCERDSRRTRPELVRAQGDSRHGRETFALRVVESALGTHEQQPLTAVRSGHRGDLSPATLGDNQARMAEKSVEAGLDDDLREAAPA
jgi:hypothetical protein